MKLKYISLAIFGAALLTACSDTDTPTPKPAEDAFVSLSMGANNGAIYTKALGDDYTDTKGLPSEAYIKRLTLIAIAQSGKVYVKDTTDIVDSPDNILLDRVGNLVIPTGTYDIFIIANGDTGDNDPVNKITSKTKLGEYMGSLTTQNNSHLLMASQLFEGVKLNPMKVSPTSDEDARLTYIYFGQDKAQESSLTARAGTETDKWYKLDATKPVKLTRMVARIQLRSITVKLTHDLVGGSFILDKAYLTNVRPATYLVANAGSFGATPSAEPYYYRGAPETVQVADHLIYPHNGAYKSSSWSYNGGNEQTHKISDQGTLTITDNNQMPKASWYAYENLTPEATPLTDGIYNTRLVIEGRIFDKNGNQRKDANGNLIQSNYSVLIRDDGAEGGMKLVERNKIYEVNVTITGLGTSNPDEKMKNAALTAKVTAAPWNIVIHTENISD